MRYIVPHQFSTDLGHYSNLLFTLIYLFVAVRTFVIVHLFWQQNTQQLLLYWHFLEGSNRSLRIAVFHTYNGNAHWHKQQVKHNNTAVHAKLDTSRKQLSLALFNCPSCLITILNKLPFCSFFPSQCHPGFSQTSVTELVRLVSEGRQQLT